MARRKVTNTTRPFESDSDEQEDDVYLEDEEDTAVSDYSRAMR